MPCCASEVWSIQLELLCLKELSGRSPMVLTEFQIKIRNEVKSNILHLITNVKISLEVKGGSDTKVDLLKITFDLKTI